MLRSGLSALSDRVDSKFLTAYWLPAFVATLGGFLILSLFVGSDQMDAWINSLDSVEQSIGAVIILLQITMFAFVLRAMTQPIAEFFAGAAMPKWFAEWSMGGQRRAKRTAERVLGIETQTARPAHSRRASQRLDQLFPQHDEDLQPTLIGNILARAAEHPRLSYAMEGLLWWPRLSPLLPSYFQDMLGGTQAPLMALLNLSVVFSGLGVLSLIVLGIVGGQWLLAVALLIGSAIVSRLCYHAAVSQSVTFANMLQVAFDLYRFEVLKQMNLEVPGDLEAERALWRRLSLQLLDLPQPAAAADVANPTQASIADVTSGSATK
jgi:hypothetical protein